MLRLFPCVIRQQFIRPANLQVQYPSILLRYHLHPKRGFANVPTVILPPVVFGGLLVALWTWKCFMMVLFQNKIIYMPGLPPSARRETIADYSSQCGGIQWREEKTTSQDGTRIHLCVASVDSGPVGETMKRVYILYFQGNGSSIPPRLPFLSLVLRILREAPLDHAIRYVLVCCSYRGYWSSEGRPSEKGIALDAVAASQWIREEDARQTNHAGEATEQIRLVIWGQSLGAGVATNLAAQQSVFSKDMALKSLILETPFIGIKAMLETLYPQKWLPYRYLSPFLWNHYDNWKALGSIYHEAERFNIKPPEILLLQAGRDELVPSSHGDVLLKRCSELGLDVQKQVVAGALHTEVMERHEGRSAVSDAIRRAGQ